MSRERQQDGPHRMSVSFSESVLKSATSLNMTESTRSSPPSASSSGCLISSSTTDDATYCWNMPRMRAFSSFSARKRVAAEPA